MGWILREAECKKQHRSQKKMEAQYTPKQRRLDPYEYARSYSCTLIGHPEEPYAQEAN